MVGARDEAPGGVDDGPGGFRASRRDGVVVLEGEMATDTDEEMVAAFAPLLVEAATRDLVLDLSGVAFCDSTGLNHLAALHRAAGDDRRIRLVGVRPMVRRVLEVTGMDVVFTFDG
jgi:anti-sigma B factor antagonist